MTIALYLILSVISAWYFRHSKNSWAKAILFILATGFMLIAIGNINNQFLISIGYTLYGFASILFIIFQLKNFVKSNWNITLLLITVVLVLPFAFSILHLPGKYVMNLLEIVLALLFIFLAIRQPTQLKSYNSIISVFSAALLITGIYNLAEIFALQ